MAVSFDVDTDLIPLRPNLDSGQAEIMIADALALAAQAAPCIDDDDFAFEAAAKAIIRSAILRWIDAGSGTITQLVAGPQQVTFAPEPRRNLFWPSEINQLAALCSDGVRGKAFTIDTTPPVVDEGS